MADPKEIAHSAEELKRMLRGLGFAATPSAALMEGYRHRTDFDALIAFGGPTGTSSCAVGFLTSEVSIQDAERVIRELTILQPDPTYRLGPRLITEYM